MDGNNSPASHGCRTPTKTAKRPPNYGGYHEEHSEGLKFKSCFYLNFTFCFSLVDEVVHDHAQL
jgi:hypothetical protein